MTSDDLKSIPTGLKSLIEQIPAHGDGISPANAKKLRMQLVEVAGELRQRITGLDATRLPDAFFDPANPRLFGIFAAVALIGQERIPLEAVGTPRFYGSGIYAIYYNGAFPSYRDISKTEHPIYVGKADPDEGGRTPVEQGERLCVRLLDHKRSIGKASANLNLSDFECRYLVVASGWEGTAEAQLINLFRPIWNKECRVVQGFGKHGDNAMTRVHDRSPWDTLHPGREWAAGSVGDAMSVKEINALIVEHFAEHPVLPKLRDVLQALLAHIRVR